jgi:hypothetical protein
VMACLPGPTPRSKQEWEGLSQWNTRFPETFFAILHTSLNLILI